jgi:hypothetical protein
VFISAKQYTQCITTESIKVIHNPPDSGCSLLDLTMLAKHQNTTPSTRTLPPTLL